MSSSALAAGVRYLRGVTALHGRDQENDEQLLHAFINRRDDSAFAALVGRYGPMVMNVCRRVLGQQQDAEDAFQATFLVLARKAAVLRDKLALAAFLHGTAHRMALKAKQSAARRRQHEGQAPSRTPANPVDELSWREVRTLLDEEIARLTEKYRSVFVLCVLEGVSREGAAKRLGLKAGTVSSRLTMARKRLGQRLAHRGVELTTVLAATAVMTPPASALPAGLMASTTKAALAAAAGEELAGIVSASVAELVRSATAAMMLSKAKMATVVLLIVATSGSLAGWYGRASGPLAATAQPLPAKADDKPKTAPPKREAAKTVEIKGRVLDSDGKPNAGAKLLLLSSKGEITSLGVSAEDGRFRVSIPKEGKESDLIAQAEGHGIDFHDLSKGDPRKPIEFRLVTDRPIRGRLVTTEGKPVAGVRVAVKSVNVYPNHSLDSFLAAWKKRHFMSGIPGGEKHLWTEAGTPLSATTDGEGCFVLQGVGDERLAAIRLRGAGLADMEAWIVNRAGFDPKPYNQATLDNAPKAEERWAARWRLHGPDVSLVAEAEKLIRGTVKDADSGKGRPGVVVRLTRINNMELASPTIEAKTDAIGCYEIHGAHKTKRYMLQVADDVAAGYLRCQVWTDDTPGYQPITADIKTRKGVIITGKIIDKATGKPIPGIAMADVLQNNPFAKDYPLFHNGGAFPMRYTDAGGTFRLVAISGPVLLIGGPRNMNERLQFKHPEPDPKYLQYFNHRDPIGFFAEYHRYGGGISPVQGNYCKVLEIKPGVQIVEEDIVLERASVLPVSIQDADGKPLSGVWVAGISPEDWHYPIQCEKAECSVYQLQPDKPRSVVFFHLARKLTGTLTLKGDEKTLVVVKLGPAGALKGRLLDADAKPLAGVVVDVYYRQRAAEEVHERVHRERQIVSDSDGAFALKDLIPEQKFELFFHRDPFKRRFKRVAKPADPTIQVKPGECRELDAIKLKPIPENAGE